MKTLASALALAALLATGSAASTVSAATNPPAPFFAAAANSSKAKPKAPAKSNFGDWNSCQGTCTLTCGDSTQEYYDVTPEACCGPLAYHGCPGNTSADGAEFWPTFSSDPGGCYAILCF